ncbi:MAG: hypothetical protein K8F91_15780 [Candidatus Obscuribacterales bacterium]|nr:hypothetical protein [Candidatus Obscuribacterales bacterium]
MSLRSALGPACLSSVGHNQEFPLSMIGNRKLPLGSERLAYGDNDVLWHVTDQDLNYVARLLEPLFQHVGDMIYDGRNALIYLA